MRSRHISRFDRRISATLTNAAFDGVLSDANIVPMHVVFAIVTGDATGALAGEGVAKLMSSVTLGTGTLQERVPRCCLFRMTILKFSTAARLLENSLRNGISKAVDKIFVDALIAGTTPIASSGNIFQDLRTAMAAAGSGTTSRCHLLLDLVLRETLRSRRRRTAPRRFCR